MVGFKNTFLIFLFVFSVCNWSGITIVSGTRCRTPAKKIGSCTLYANCNTLRDTVVFPEMLNTKDCENSGLSGVVVCCPRAERRRLTSKPITTTTSTTTMSTSTSTSTSTTTTTDRPQVAASPSRMYISTDTPLKQNSINSELENLHPDGLALLNKHRCGRIQSDRIANGQDVALDEFPWVAMLLYANNQPKCGGSVITERFVLTAAHCINSALYSVRLGEHTVSTQMDCIADVLCVTYKDFGIEKTIIHPDYNYIKNVKDIALIKLRETIQFASIVNIKPICLPTKPEEFQILPSNDLIISGWGLKENDQPVDILQKGLLKPEPLDICKSMYSRYSVDESKICTRAGSNDAVSCRGDSGGPLFWKARYRTPLGLYRERYTQIGLVSLGYMYKCGSLTNVPFMFENVTHSMVWITHSILN